MERELIGRGQLFLIGQMGRIIAREAGVAIARLPRIAIGRAQRLVQAVDRNEGEAVRTDIGRHFGDVHLRGGRRGGPNRPGS